MIVAARQSNDVSGHLRNCGFESRGPPTPGENIGIRRGNTELLETESAADEDPRDNLLVHNFLIPSLIQGIAVRLTVFTF
jgi:hypothetical protein